MMQDQRVGWMRSASLEGESGEIITEMEMRMQITRGPATIPIEIDSAFHETPAGDPIRMRSTMRLGMAPVTTIYHFGDDEVRIVTEQLGRTSERVMPLPDGAWMTPGAASRHMQFQLEEGAESFTVSTIDPTVGLQVVESEFRILDRDVVVEALGRTIPAIRWSVRQSYMPGVEQIEYVNHQGESVRSEVNVGGMAMTILAADRELALSELTPVEIMASTLAKPDRPIENPRRTRRAAYILSLSEGKLPDLPSVGAQRFERIDARSGRIVTDLDARASAPDAEASDDVFLESSMMLDIKDPKIIELAERACADLPAGAEHAQIAETLRRFVSGYIDDKTLDVGFASASEVCRTRQGDCTEHGVLLAALLRARGVPARVVSGLIYVDEFLGAEGIFGYHMWTQALLEVDGDMRWVDLDATLSKPSDATHIALSHSALSDGEMINSMAALAPLIGKLEIRIESYE